MGTANFIGNMLGSLGQGVSQLPEMQRRRRAEEEDSKYKAAQLALQQAQVGQGQRQLEATLAQNKFANTFKTAENLPANTRLSPQMASDFQGYGFPTKPEMTMDDETIEKASQGEEWDLDPTGNALSVPLEGPALLREQTRVGGVMAGLQQKGAQFDEMMKFRRDKLAQDSRIANMVNSARVKGNNMAAERISMMAAQLSFMMDKAEFDQAMDIVNAQADDPARVLESFNALASGGQVAPMQYPTPPTFTKPSIPGVPNALKPTDPINLGR